MRDIADRARKAAQFAIDQAPADLARAVAEAVIAELGLQLCEIPLHNGMRATWYQTQPVTLDRDGQVVA
jgi:hypothetical protein